MPTKLEQRVADLEKRVAALQQTQMADSNGRAWLDDLYGRFANDPVFEHAMGLGREYRLSLRPRAGKSGPKK